ncbi:hypothetical protein KSD_30740 [Ktedonobacter sp. SOSP1-85]|uniref:hypothetical protein n=1 Tax=Ktedonobacter sp. SOSP1-85 TaxID=2778367 RepID=UPI0019155E48|nr:hypothetical protein [Ktedonobacter sp. SOSP1-85]GHO75303.1 hypothetical protein KSD_30740 [Ktedonobacter sp. SOSP1-85]
MRSIFKGFNVSLVLAMLLGIVLFAGTATQAHAASKSISPQVVYQNKQAKTSNTPASWVQRADPYVHIINGTATIDPAISQHLSTDEIAQVQNAVNHYNKLPLSTRQHPHVSGTYKPNTMSPNSTAYQWSYDWYWWGVRIWLNSPAAQNLGGAMAFIGASIGASIGAAVGGPLGVTAGAIVGLILSVGGWSPTFYDNQCGNKGVFIDINWYLQPSVTPVC